MFEPTSTGIALIFTFIPLPAWGLWPTLRGKCGAPVPAFAALNMSAQLIMSVFWAFTLGMISGHDETFTSAMSELFGGKFDIHCLAVMGGGFMLGHADHLGAFAMQYISPGIAYPMYAGVALLFGSILNYIQVAPGSTLLWALGLALVFIGVSLLAVISTLDADRPGGAKMTFTKSLTDSIVGPPTASQASQQLGASGLSDYMEAAHLDDINTYHENRDVDTARGSLDFGEVKGEDDENLGEHPVSQNLAMAVCIGAGLAGSAWSPLSTFGRAGDSEGARLLNDPYVCLFLFCTGELLAWPSVALLSGYMAGTGVCAPLSELTPRSVVWGLICGTSVSAGYMSYYLGSSVIAATACFGIANCNPLLALLIDVFVLGSFNDSTSLVKTLLGACILTYCSAIALLVASG